jgi:hypothetical protein
MTTKIFTAILTGDQEVPANASTAIGLGVVLWDTASDTARYGILTKGVDFGEAAGTGARTRFEGDDVVNMHVHNQARGANGAVVFGQIGPAQDADDLRIVHNADGSGAIAGAWEPSDPAAASIVTFAAALDAARPGEEVPLYFNVHTSDFPGGEMRGQWVALGVVEKGEDGKAGRLEASLDAEAGLDLFEAFLRFLGRDAHSDRDPAHEGSGHGSLLKLLGGLAGGADPLDHIIDRGLEVAHDHGVWM